MILFGLLLMVLGCSDTESKDEEPNSLYSFQDKVFVLQSAEDYEPVGSQMSLGFSADTLHLWFDAGCNRYDVTYTYENDLLHGTSIGGTEMGCEADLMEQDELLVDFFTSHLILTYEGNVLSLERIDDNHSTLDFTLHFVEE